MYVVFLGRMKALTIREVPDAVYAVIRQEAEANHRSIQEQVRYVLEKEARLRQGGFRAAALHWRERTKGRPLGDTVKDIRQARARR